MHAFGCIVYVKRTDDKLGARAVEGHWLSFDETSNGHRIYLQKDRKVIIKRNVTFSAWIERLVKGELSDHNVDLKPTENLENSDQQLPERQQHPTTRSST
jgi:hypothetical protein